AVAFAFLCLLLEKGAELAGPMLIGGALDAAVLHRDVVSLDRYALLFLGSVLLAFVFNYLQTLTVQQTGQRAMHDLRQTLFTHLTRQDLAFFDKNPVGRLMTRVINDVENLNELFSTGLVTFLGDSLTLVGIAAALLWLDWRLALLTFLVAPALFVLTAAYRRRARANYRETRKVLARLNAYLQEHISGMATVQVFGQELRAQDRFQEINTRYRDLQVRSVRYNALFFPVVEVLSALSVGLIFAAGGWLAGAGGVAVGEVVAFILYVQRAYRPVRDLAEKYNIFQAAMASGERIVTLLETHPTLLDPAMPRASAPFRGEVEFQGVSLEYVPGEPVLRDVSFRVAPGEKVALVGATGAGKTSLISLLCRFYDVTAGRILVDGIDIREWDRVTLRRQLGLVLQDVFLFSGDIAGNIGLEDPRISAEAVEAAARRVRADAFIGRLPGGYAEPVQERGATLSQGERQLLAFARALAFDPRILILDEATSSVDTETERLIQEALQTLLQGRTALIIAHRLSTVRFVDRILVVHRGRIREEGRHQDLLRRGGIYARLYQLQYLPQEVRAG
ncbi:MAG TPA: ABC transporter ATP-binding protein, partial [Candidatus Methylomirabilis sp.]|nr:ABC transporter ATP-binding protein [Candidatus Methylomirabilis sp.]